MADLYIIPARGGSKGIPGKNLKILGGKPLIYYGIDVARSLANDEDICISTDDEQIKAVVEKTGLKVPFLRPPHLATDSSGTYEVLMHALDFYKSQGRNYDRIILLQPTSPFRKTIHVKEAINAWDKNLEMVVSVKITKSNPYYVLFEENEYGFLQNSKRATFKRRQDCPVVYEYNGAIYIIDVESLRKRSLSSFERIRKYVMDEIFSLDLDTELDWKYAEYLIENRELI